MQPWEDRPTEVANLLNPAFLGVLLRKAVDGYAEKSDGGMPFELAFLVLPLCLHPDTVRRLPARAASTPLHAWLQEDEVRDVVVAVGERASALVPFTREAILFAVQRRTLLIDESGRLRAGEITLKGITSYQDMSEGIKRTLSGATLVGRWFALAGTTATIYTLLGVRP